MSTVRANTYQDASSGNNAIFQGVASPPNSMGFRNRILNGGMVIDQRNAGASVTLGAGNTYTLDRWEGSSALASKFSVQQSSVAPAGFTNSLLCTSLAATTPGSGDQYSIRQKIEGFNVADLGWGAAGAQSVTLSFWVRSSLTGTFGGSVLNSGFTRSYPFTFTVSAANTWEQKTVVITGDTSGTWLTNSSLGLMLNFSIGAGSTVSGTAGAWSGSDFRSATGATSVVGTNGATFYITGVQLEAGTNASPFERRSYGQELALCQRYFQSWGGTAAYEYIGVGCAQASNSATIVLPLQVQMRSAPSLSVSSASHFRVFNGSSYLTATALAANAASTQVCGIDVSTASGITSGTFWQLGANNSTSARLQLSSEL